MEELDAAMRDLREAMRGIPIRRGSFRKTHDNLARDVAQVTTMLDAARRSCARTTDHTAFLRFGTARHFWLAPCGRRRPEPGTPHLSYGDQHAYACCFPSRRRWPRRHSDPPDRRRVPGAGVAVPPPADRPDPARDRPRRATGSARPRCGVTIGRAGGGAGGVVAGAPSLLRPVGRTPGAHLLAPLDGYRGGRWARLLDACELTRENRHTGAPRPPRAAGTGGHPVDRHPARADGARPGPARLGRTPPPSPTRSGPNRSPSPAIAPACSP